MSESPGSLKGIDERTHPWSMNMVIAPENWRKKKQAVGCASEIYKLLRQEKLRDLLICSIDKWAPAFFVYVC